MERTFKTNGWSLIPGPAHIEVSLSSLDLYEITEYDPAEISKTFLSIAGVQLVHDATPTWYDWKAQWIEKERWIEIRMSLFAGDSEIWGGSELRADCFVSDVVALWLNVRETHAAIWLHSPDCQIYTIESFLAEYCD